MESGIQMNCYILGVMVAVVVVIVVIGTTAITVT